MQLLPRAKEITRDLGPGLTPWVCVFFHGFASFGSGLRFALPL